MRSFNIGHVISVAVNMDTIFFHISAIKMLKDINNYQ